MHSLAIVSAAFSLMSSSMASPTSSPAPTSTPFSFLSVTFSIYTGPSEYQNVTFSADGQIHNFYLTRGVATSIDGNGYSPYFRCNFNGPSQETISLLGDGNVQIAPEQPLYGITCQPTPAPPATCLPVQTTCRWNSNQGGSFGLNCCSGICAANFCRAGTSPP